MKRSSLLARGKPFWVLFILLFIFGNHPRIIARAAPPPLIPQPALADKPPAASVPSVSLNVPAEAFIGENVTFTVTFDNPDPTDPGYGPIIDLILPTNGADGAQNTNPPLDGLTFVSATYLGVNVESTVLTFPGSGGVTCVNHPYIVNNTGSPVQVCGNAGDTFVALRLPFGSFTPDQPPLNVDVTVSMSNLADLGVPLTIQARGGYQFGYTPLNDYTTDPPNATLSAWTSASVTPILFTLQKTYNGPEDETATGPNFPRRYTVTATIASGQILSPFTLTDVLPANMQFVSLVSTSPGGASCTLPSTTTPGGTLSCDFASVSGTVTMTFEYYIPLRDAGGGSVIDPATGDDATSCNNASGGGTWTPIDPRDTGGTFTQDPAGCEHTLTDKSIAIQKSVSVVGGGDPAPGKYLEYTLDFQVSDFFAFNNIVITDVISDGQHFAPGFVPTLEINGNGYTLAAAAMNASNVTTSCNYTGATASPPAPPGECDSLDPAPNDGSTTIVFNVSQEIIARGQDGRLIGGCVPTTGTGGGDPDCGTYDNGPTTGRIVFRTLIQEDFTDTYPSGDPSVDQGDVLDNAVNINGDVLSTSDASTPTGQTEADTSAASVQIGRGALTKTIYAVNGSTSFSTPVHVSPGDTVTYRLTYTLPTSDFEDLVITDYLPLPVFNATQVTSFSNTICGVPAAGASCLGPSDTYNTLPGAVIPILSTNGGDNWVRWAYGDYDSASNAPSTIDLLFTVTVTTNPFADGLYLTNQGFAQEGSTNSSSSSSTGIVQIILDQPVVANLSKGVVWTDNPNGVFSPPTVGPVTFNGMLGCPAWSGGNITSSGLASNPVNSNLSNVDAADQVMMAIIIENTGHASAFDVRVRDSLPPGMTYVSNSLCVTDGTGAPFIYLSGGLDGSGLFDADGIELVDPGPTLTPPGALDPGKDSGGNVINNGRNIAVITYLVTLDTSVQGGQFYTNTATLFNYAGAEGGPDHTAVDPTDTAQIQIRYDGLGKTFTTEIINGVNSQTQAVIGEFVDYTLTITFHEGTTPNVTLEDNLPTGLAFVDCLSITPSTGLSTNLTGGFAAACNDPTNPAVSSPGQNFTFTLGTITNANTDNSVDETLVIVFRAVVLNVPGNQAGTTLQNSATLRIDGGAGGTATVQSAPLTVIEPVINTSKSVLPATADAGDTVTFTVTLTNPASASTTAYDVTWSDTVPPGLTYVPGTLALGACTASTPLILSDASAPTLTGSGGLFQPGQSCTLTFDAAVDYSVTPGQVITNIAQTQWTSLPGAVSDRSTYNTDSDERTGADGVGGALNDYASQGQATVTINNITPQKFLVDTSEAHTGAPDGTQRVAIGEIVRYRLVVQLPEGTSINFQIRDYLPDGLTYLDDGTARLALLSNGAPIASTEPTGSTLGLALGSGPFGSGPWVNGNDPTLVTPTYVLPDQNVGSSNSLTADPDSYGNSTDPYFKLGTLTNNDSDADAEYVILEFNALINNTAAGNNNAGTNRDNNFRVFINNMQNGPTSNNVRVRIAEPSLSITKSVVTAPVDAGDPIVYTLTISAASGTGCSGFNGDCATAFDLSLTDTFDAYLTGLSVTNVTTTQGATCTGNGGGTTPFSHNGGSFTANTLTFTASCLDPGQSITVTVSGTVAASAPAGYTIPNTANLTYTSLPGPNGTTVNPTGSSTPGASGSDTGERDGSGTPTHNDHYASSSANAPLAAPQIVKQAPTPTGYPIGATVTYPIAITLPEGVTRNVRVTDAVPAGMQYVSYSVDTSAFNGSVPVPTVSGGAGDGDDVTFNFGDITTTDDNNPANNTFTLLVTLRVLDVPANEIGTVLTNGASLTYTPGTGSTDTTLDGGTQNITVLEPRIATTKSVVPNSNVQAGDILTYTVRFTNSGTSTAYDVTAEDVLAQGVAYNNDAACVFFDGASSSAIPVTVTAGVGTLTFDGNPAGAWDIPATDPDSYIECTYTATAQSSLHLDGTHTNTVDADWTSLDGPDANERVYDDSVSRTVDGTQDTDSAAFTSPAPTFDKSDTATNLPIGATYSVTLTITSPLGTLRNLTVTDTLPAGLFYVTGTQSVGGGIAPAPTFAVSDPNDGSAPTTLIWTFGDAVVSSSPVTITYNVTVANVAGNQNGVTRTNNAALTYNDAQGNAKSLTDNDNVTVIEPVLTVNKVISVPPSPPDAGGTVTYQVTLQHDGASTSTAYDTNFSDALPADLTLNLASVNVTLAGGASGATNASAGNTVNVTIATIPIGGSVTITYSATLNSGVAPGQIITNTGNLTWTSTSGANANERDGSGGINDYAASDQESFAIQGAAYDKTLEATSAAHTGGNDLAIGEVATFGLYVTLPEGTTPSLTIVDDLPTGLAYVSGSAQVVTTVAGCGSLTADFNGSVPAPTITAPGGSGGDVTFTFGTITVAADNDPANNTFVICFDAVLLNEAGNQNGNTLTNNVSFQIDGGPLTTDSTTVDVVEPELDIAKAVSNPTPGVGQTFTYTLTIQHLLASTADAFDLNISDNLPASVAVSLSPTVSDAPGGCAGTVTDSSAGNNISLTVASLPLGCVLTVQYQAVIVSPPAAPGDVITNTANLTWTSLIGVDPNERSGTGGANDYADSASESVAFTTPDLTITKTDGQTSYVPGLPVVYTIVVSNVGNGDALGATVSDAIPPQITSWTWTCSTTGGATCNGSGGPIATNFSDTVNLPANASITYTVTAQTDPAATTNLTNTATVTPPTGITDPTPGDNTASDTDTPNPQADLSVTKDDSASQYVPGGTLTYTITVSNAGPSDAPGSLVSDPIPSQFTFWTWTCAPSGGATCSGSGGPITTDFSETVNLPAGSSITYTVTAQVASSATGDLTNTVTVTPPAGVTDPTPGNNTVSDTDTQNSQAAISVTKDDGVSEYIPGGTLTYFITVTNTGPSDALGVSVSDNIPPQITSWTWTCAPSGGATCSGSGGPITTDFSDTVNLPAGSSITYTVTAQTDPAATTSLTNTVTILHPADTTPGDNTASDTDTPNFQADLYVTKDDGSATYTPGVNVTYTVTIGNNGPSDVIGAVLTDNIPTQATSWTWVCFSSTGGASGCDPYSGSGNFSDTVDLPAGSSIIYTVTVVIPSSATGDLVNTATIAPPSGTTDPDPDNNESTDTDTQLSQVDLRITKDDGVSQYVPGTSLTYTIVVSNAGPSDAIGAVVSDTLPTQFTAWEWSCEASSGAVCNGSGGLIDTDFYETVDMPVGSVITYTVFAQVSSAANGNLLNAVTVEPPDGATDPTPEDNRAEDTDTPNPQADLLVTKDDGLSVIAPGATITYTITVQNLGPSDVIGAVISDTKPAQIFSWAWACAGSSGGASGCTPYSGSGDFSDAVDLPAGSVLTYTVTALVDPAAEAGSLENWVSVTPPEGVDDPDPSNNDDEDIDPILTEPSGDLVKSILASNQEFTPLPSVAIGEVITYEVGLKVPAASVFSDLVLSDVLERGFAFLGCEAVFTSTDSITTTLSGGFGAACNDPTNPVVQSEPLGSPDPVDGGRRVTFTLGEVSNTGTQDGYLRLRYRVVVLNSPENHDGVSLQNQVTATWSGGSLSTAAPQVVVVEPDLILEKKVDRNVALPGTILTFTLTFRHSPRSTADAFNVVVRDTLPPELTYIPASLLILNGPPGGVIDDSGAPKLKVSWDYFPLLSDGQPSEAIIQFQARLGQVAPGQSVKNMARLEWSTLPEDVPMPQSPYNNTSNERYYLPTADVQIRTLERTAEVTVPLMPLTGFPPDRITSLPAQPADQAYTALSELWLEIPKLKVNVPIVGIPPQGKGWDLTWLWDQAGWLEGTAFPTHQGNAALTAHAYLPNGLAGPFARLSELLYGDRLIIHLGGQRYIFEVREVNQVLPNSLSAFRHETYPWLTLITCKEYDERLKQYRYRIVVRAVLVKVED